MQRAVGRQYRAVAAVSVVPTPPPTLLRPRMGSLLTEAATAGSGVAVVGSGGVAARGNDASGSGLTEALVAPRRGVRRPGLGARRREHPEYRRGGVFLRHGAFLDSADPEPPRTSLPS